jgi:hypothetical protein
LAFHQLAGCQCKQTHDYARDNTDNGPMSAIMALGESGSGIDFIIATSCA